MNLIALTELVSTGEAKELELLSLEGGFYLLRALTDVGPVTLSDALGQPVRVRSTTELRHLLGGLPPVPCTLVQQVVHDETCGPRDARVAPLRPPPSPPTQW